MQASHWSGVTFGLAAAVVHTGLLVLALRQALHKTRVTGLTRVLFGSVLRLVVLGALFLGAVVWDRIHVGYAIVVFAAAHLMALLAVGFVLARAMDRRQSSETDSQVTGEVESG